MTNLLHQGAALLSTAILHSVWQVAVIGLLYLLLSPWRMTSQQRYLLAMVLLLLAPVTFVGTMVLSLMTPVPISSASASVSGWPWTTYLCALWVLGAAFESLRFVGGWIWLRAVVLRSSVTVDPELLEVFFAARERLRVSSRVILRASTRIAVPMAFGAVRPVVLLPLAMIARVPPDLLRAALLHELSHLRRWDHLAVVVHAVGDALLFFHPVFRWLSREVHRLREYRCDDDCVRALGDPKVYARALLMLEASRPERAVPALSMKGGELMDRVTRLFESDRSKRRPSLWGLAAVGALAVAATTHVSSCDGGSAVASTPSPKVARLLEEGTIPPAVGQYHELLERSAAAHQVPADLLALMMLVESGGDRTAVSPYGARGLMQVMPATGARIAAERGITDYAPDRLFDPATSIDFGAWYLARQVERFQGRGEDPTSLAIAAYNAGPHAVEAYLNDGANLPEETQRYRQRLLSLWLR